MTLIPLTTIPREYKNGGQHAEQVFRFTMLGSICKADNRPATECGDCGDIQVKSARATICKGTDLQASLNADAAKSFAYVTADFTTAFLMTRGEYTEFVTEFGTVTRESAKNGGAEKIRLGHETRAMLKWLGARV